MDWAPVRPGQSLDGLAGLVVKTRSSGPGRHVTTVLLRGGRLAAHGTWRMPRATQVGLGLDWPPPRAAGHGTGAARAVDYPPFGIRLGLDSPQRTTTSAAERTLGGLRVQTPTQQRPAIAREGIGPVTECPNPTRAGWARRDEAKTFVTRKGLFTAQLRL